MTLLDEYLQNREKKGREKGENNIIKNLLKAGMKAEIIAKTTKMPLSRVKAIEKTLNTENLP